MNQQEAREHDAHAAADEWHHAHPAGLEGEDGRRASYLAYRATHRHAPVPYWRWRHGSISPLGLTDDEAERYGLPRKSSRNPDERRNPGSRRHRR